MRIRILIAVGLAWWAICGCAADAPPGSAGTATPSASASASAPGPAIPECQGGPKVPLTSVTVPVPGGETLVAGVAGDGPLAVAIANTTTGSHCDWMIWADHLVRQGHRVAVYNYGFLPNRLGVKESLKAGPAELAALGARLRELGARKVVYAGGSLGGSIALTVAAEPENQAAGVISLSGGYEVADELRRTVRRLAVPALYAVTRDDPLGVAKIAERLHAATPEGKGELLRYPGTQHAHEMFHGTPYLEELMSGLDAFLARL